MADTNFLTDEQIAALNCWSKSDPALGQGVLFGEDAINFGDLLNSAAAGAITPSPHPMQGISTDKAFVGEYFNDFMSFQDASDETWVKTFITTSGSPFFDLGSNNDNGAGTLSTPFTNGDTSQIQQSTDGTTVEQKPFSLTLGRKLGFACLIDNNDDDFNAIVGLCEENTTLLSGVNNGVFFRYTPGVGTNTVEFVSVIGGVETVVPVLSAGFGADAFYGLGFSWDGEGTITIFRTQASQTFGFTIAPLTSRKWLKIGTVVTTNIPTREDGFTTGLSISMALDTPGGASQLFADYFHVKYERP